MTMIEKLGLAVTRLGHHPHHAALGARQGEERRGEPGARVLPAQVDQIGRRLERLLGGQDEASGAVDLHGDGHRPGLVEHLIGDGVADPQLRI